MSKSTRPADKQYTGWDGHEYENRPRYSQSQDVWYFTSATATHSNDCRCHEDPDFLK